MNPIKFAQMMKYLTRAKNVDPNLPKVTTADKIEIPPKKQTVEEMEAINAFMRRNPRVEKAGGGMLVQPGFGGTRQGYAKPVGNRKGQFTSKSMDNISDAILKAYADDDISLLFEKTKANPTGLISPEDAKQGMFSKIKVDQDRLNTIVKNTGLDQETILNIIDDRDAYIDLERTSSSQATRYKDRIKFFNQAEKWLTTNAKRYSDPEKLEKAFNRTFGKNNLIAQTIKANITEARGKGRLSGFSDDFIKTIMSVREGTTKADDAFNSKQLKDMFKTVIYNYNPNVRKKITTIFENIIPEPGSKRTPDIRNLFANNATLKKFGLDKSIKGPIARLIANEINEDLLTNVKNFQKPFLGTDALLSFLKDRVDPKYKEMFREASNAVKLAQKNQWPEAKKTLNIAQDLNFDHKIPKSIIDLGYADEIEYIKVNPTSQKFNQTIKRSQFDTPMNDLIRKFEQTKTLDGKAAVVKEMNELKNNFSKKYGGYLDEVTITPDKTGKPIFKSSAAPVTKKTDFVSSLGKSMIQTGEIDEKKFKKLINTLENSDQIRLARIGCPGKATGGRIGYFEGQNLTACATKGAEKLKNNPLELTGGDQQNLRALSKSAKTLRFLKNFLGPGAVVGELIFEGGVAANKFLNEGMPIKQALGESYINKYLLGPKTQIDVEAERKKELLEREMPDGTKIMLEDTPFNIATGEEFAAAKRGERMFLPQGESAIDRRLKEKEDEMKALYPQLKDANLSNERIDEILKEQNVFSPFTLGFGMQQMQPGIGDTKYNEDVAYQEIRDLINQAVDKDIQSQQFQNIADAGGVANLAGGGIAGLSGGVDQGPPPESGPNSQGLQGLMKRVKNI